MIALWLGLAQPAFAWEWDGTETGGCSNVTWPVPSVGYLMFAVDGDFTTAEREAIEEGMLVWSAGPGTVNRGADFEYRIDGLKSGSQSATNQVNEIWHMTQADGVNIYGLSDGWAGWGPSVGGVGCLFIAASDVVLNRDASWKTTLPSVGSGTSLTTAVAHEGGHNMGLGHEPDHPAVMYRHEFAQNGNAARLGEDEYSFLRSQFPLNSNTGKNFMLTKFNTEATGSRPVSEGWTISEKGVRPWGSDVCGNVAVADGPAPIWASVNGTATSYASIPIDWTLSSDQVCFDGDDITIGTRAPTMSSNAPYEVEPTGGSYLIPSNTPDGDYWVCAGINPDQTESEAESSFIDNTVISEAKWTIDCP